MGCPNRVREIRKELMMTQRVLARKSGVALRTITNVEDGAGCRQDTKRKIIHGLGMDFSEKGTVFFT